MIEKLKRFNRIRIITANRMIYIIILASVYAFAWITGERLAYLTAAVLTGMPLVSYVLTFLVLRSVKVQQNIPSTIVKAQDGFVRVHLHNRSPLPINHLECTFVASPYAIEPLKDHQIIVPALKPVVVALPFHAYYRGEYDIGLKSVIATDFMGIFRLRKKFRRPAKILVLPRIVEFSNMPLALSLVAEASSRFDIRDEDYSVISDVRPYVPTDSIKRVHWKLTAKRNEWMVKMFQSNALNHVTIILDNLRMPVPEAEIYPLEDSMVENALGLARFCLNRGMPVDFMVTDGNQTRAQSGAQFEAVYHLASDVRFDQAPPLSPVSVLAQVLNDAAGNVTAVIFTAVLDGALYERVLNAVAQGNYTAIIYFATETPDEESEKIFTLLEEGGLPCFRAEGGLTGD